jgi:hypothetical protein
MTREGNAHLFTLVESAVSEYPARLTSAASGFWISIQSEASPKESSIVSRLLGWNSEIRSTPWLMEQANHGRNTIRWSFFIREAGNMMCSVALPNKLGKRELGFLRIPNSHLEAKLRTPESNAIPNTRNSILQTH